MNHLPSVYIKNNDYLAKPKSSDEITVNLQRIIRSYGSSNEIIVELKKINSSSNWNTTWIILALESFGWYRVRDVFWKRRK